MEDRYLFRGKRIDNGEWAEGNLIQNSDAEDGWEAIIIPAKNSNMFTKHIKHGYGDLGYENWYRVDTATVCQCTGLKDKNGKLIYENDIVKCGNTTVVVWNEHFASWCLTKKGWMYHHFFGESQEPKDCEVIGNTFDNPELLEA